MTQTRNVDSKTQAEAQQKSAAASVDTAEKEKALATAPAASKAKIFRTTQPGQSMQMRTKAGKPILFVDGQFVTTNKADIEYLQAEVDDGNPHLQGTVEEVEPRKTMAEVIAEAEARAVENYKRMTLGGNASGGVSDQSGGSITTSQNMASHALVGQPQTAVDAMATRSAIATAGVASDGSQGTVEESNPQVVTKNTSTTMSSPVAAGAFGIPSDEAAQANADVATPAIPVKIEVGSKKEEADAKQDASKTTDKK